MQSLDFFTSKLREQRFRVVLGNLSTPCFGLSLPEFEALGCTISLIYHCAADVKFFDVAQGYRILKGANVDGTAEVLRLAMMNAHQHAHMVHISTTSVEESRYVCPLQKDESRLSISTAEDAGAYCLTKAVSEVLVRRIGHRLNVKPLILRLPLLTWSARGVANDADWLVRLVDSCRLLHLRPECRAVSSWLAPIPYLPVDSCAALVTQLARQAPTPSVVTRSLQSSSVVFSVQNVIESQFGFLSVVDDFSFLTGIDGASGIPLAPLASSFLSEQEPSSSIKNFMGVSSIENSDDSVEQLAHDGISWRTGLEASSMCTAWLREQRSGALLVFDCA
jgi:thioester reductase-like protein